MTLHDEMNIEPTMNTGGVVRSENTARDKILLFVIGVLVGAARRSQEAGTSFVVTNPQRNVARVLSLLGVGAELGVEGA